MMGFKILKEQAGDRLDKFLAGKLPEFSRAKIQKQIKSGNVLINNKKVTPHYNLKESDIVQAVIVKQPILKEENEKNKSLIFNLKSAICIIADTPEYIVVNKPAGLIMHGAPHIKEPTLVDFILEKYPKVKKAGEDPDRPGIVHRIDKDASGLVVIAKTFNSFNNLKKQFQERTVKKQYTALVYGKIEKEEDEINFPLSRAGSGHKMAARPLTFKGSKSQDGKIAITEFKVVKRHNNYTLLDVIIKTGRTHQIRAHLAAYGHPIVGDNLYGTKKTRLHNKKLDFGRVFLVAYKLAFNDLAGKRQEFEAEMPDKLKKFLKNFA